METFDINLVKRPQEFFQFQVLQVKNYGAKINWHKSLVLMNRSQGKNNFTCY